MEKTNNGLAAPVITGLAVGVAVVALVSALSTQLPPVVSPMSHVETINISPPDEDNHQGSQGVYSIVPVNKSKEIVISNSGWGMTLRHVETLMTIDSITIYYADDHLVRQNTPSSLERKDGFIPALFNYTMKSLSNDEYYATVAVDVIVDGTIHQGRASGGELTLPLNPGESASSWQALDIPEDADEVTLAIRDSETDRRVWTLQLDMQPYGLKPSKDSRMHDFSQLPDDFALVYSYGIGEDITLNTKKGLIIVNTCDDPRLQNVTVSLSKEQLQRIWHTVLQNDFFELPDFTESCPSSGPFGPPCIGIEPESSAKLQITGYGQTHIVDFRQNYERNWRGDENSDFGKYMMIASMLEEEVIAQYEEKLPESRCFYA